MYKVIYHVIEEDGNMPFTCGFYASSIAEAIDTVESHINGEELIDYVGILAGSIIYIEDCDIVDIFSYTL